MVESNLRLKVLSGSRWPRLYTSQRSESQRDFYSPAGTLGEAGKKPSRLMLQQDMRATDSYNPDEFRLKVQLPNATYGLL